MKFLCNLINIFFFFFLFFKFKSLLYMFLRYYFPQNKSISNIKKKIVKNYSKINWCLFYCILHVHVCFVIYEAYKKAVKHFKNSFKNTMNKILCASNKKIILQIFFLNIFLNINLHKKCNLTLYHFSYSQYQINSGFHIRIWSDKIWSI